ncbi:MAG: PD40 domain-containing protein [Rubrivivax sp.]|nr:PD40 domain-containing protein [Rubrivivax sp.]
MTADPRETPPQGGWRPDASRIVLVLVALLLAAVLLGCGGAATSQGEGLTVTGEVPLVYAKRSSAVRMNPTNGAPSAPGGDLMLREKSSPSAPEHNLTAAITQGQGDVSDPEVSYDGKKVVFALRCPSAGTAQIDGAPACTGRWNLWEYDMTGAASLAAGKLRRITASTDADDVDPVYLPDGRGFVFSSNRQAKSRLNQALGRAYLALDEYERERVFNLHTVNPSGGNLQQISFNQSHERNPVIRANGDIMFARWEHVADRNRFAIFRAKPDGTDLFVLYGAHSPGNSYLHPREMDPAGRYKGFVATSLMPLSGTHEGGSLVFIDAANYSEQDTPANNRVPTQGGNTEPTAQTLESGRGLSRWGRVTSPYPLWDGTDRVLVAYRPCEVTRAGAVVPCANLTAAELARLSSDRSMAAEAADELQDNVPPNYAIYLFDPKDQTWLNVAAPPSGFMHVDPVPLIARAEPNAPEPTNVDAALAAQGMALIEVRSVFDTDGLDRMGRSMIVAADLPAGCSSGIPQTAPLEAQDTRARVADLLRLKDPADAAYGCNPVRFVRALRGIPPPSGSTGLRAAIGETDFEQQQILGYAPIEPDGSFKLKVPADVPLALQVVDAQGRGFQTHTNWIQVRPGERRTCDGCHSPRRGGAINSGSIVDTLAAGIQRILATARQGGETMAGTRTRLDPALLNLSRDPQYLDAWADAGVMGVTPRTRLSLAYTGNADPAQDLRTAVPLNGVINYPEHIAPLWTRDRGAATCVNCHTGSARLDLRSTVAGTGRLVSYEELLVGDPQIDPATGRPVTRLEDGVPVVQRLPALVETSSGAMNTAGQARKSRLTEILFGQSLLASAAARAAHPQPPADAPDHATLLNVAEKRLLAEWMDLGGQYYNDPFTPGAGVRSVTGLSEASFASEVLPVLRANCASACHQAVGTNAAPSGASFRENRFVLTGDATGDYGATLSMINDTCNPGANPLLRRPSTAPHPQGAAGAAAVLPAGSAGYQAIAGWISRGCAGS